MCVCESLGQTFASPRSHPHPHSHFHLRLRYTCIRRWTLLGQQLDPAWIDCESRPPTCILSARLTLYPVSVSESYAWAWTAPSLWQPVTSRRLPHGEHLRSR